MYYGITVKKNLLFYYNNNVVILLKHFAVISMFLFINNINSLLIFKE